MKKEDLNMDKIDDIINLDRGHSKYEPSSDYVDSLMDKIETIDLDRSRSFSLLFISAAAVAILFLLTNVSVILFNSNSSISTEIMDEWAGLYQQDAGESWYNSDDLDMLATVTTINEDNE
ncbi:hypothetical protein [Carboxylicivirga sp. N1Y90]|uniref:hypothetical protein n=1 Tax=Carboxylicivirga fragile TaxID=3417571 RepID=UPI003D32B648|nr:hypothetical protein [Marinilabiliaceae bacterium N1Y90]